jgi:hypothetical protein
MRQWLPARAWDATAEALADREIDRRLTGGAEIASDELPVMSDIDADLPW